MGQLFLIEESAVKEYYRFRGSIPKALWDWLESDGPLIRAEPVRELPGGLIRFRAPAGFIDLPSDVVNESFND